MRIKYKYRKYRDSPIQEHSKNSRTLPNLMQIQTQNKVRVRVTTTTTTIETWMITLLPAITIMNNFHPYQSRTKTRAKVYWMNSWLI